MSDLALLRLLQFGSGFPIGSFAHSSGLETYAQAGLDKPGLAELEGQLETGFGRLGAAACLAFQAEKLAALEDLCVTLTAWKP